MYNNIDNVIAQQMAGKLIRALKCKGFHTISIYQFSQECFEFHAHMLYIFIIVKPVYKAYCNNNNHCTFKVPAYQE